jgi:hypothetical protein
MTFLEYLNAVGERRFADRKRRQELKLARVPNMRLLANVIGCALVSGFLGALAALFVIPIPADNKELIIYMLGQLSGFAGGIVAYHYTSKAGEKELDAKRVENTGKLTDLVGAALNAKPNEETGTSPEQAADQVAGAAADEAESIRRNEQ